MCMYALKARVVMANNLTRVWGAIQRLCHFLKGLADITSKHFEKWIYTRSGWADFDDGYENLQLKYFPDLGHLIKYGIFLWEVYNGKEYEKYFLKITIMKWLTQMDTLKLTKNQWEGTLLRYYTT